MNSRLERLKVTIGKCQKVEEIFAKQGIRGKEPEYYDDLIAGFNAATRGGFHFGWSLVFKTPVSSRSDEEERNAEPTYIEVKLKSEEDELFEVDYFPDTDTWGVEGSTEIGNDGTEATRSLAADCRVSAGDFRRIGEDEAMKIIATICAFYKAQPV